MRVACLHTNPINVAAFEAARPAGIELFHHVRSDLRMRARRGTDAGLIAEAKVFFGKLGQGMDAVLVTCSVLHGMIPPHVFTTDGFLAAAAAGHGKNSKVEIFFANPAVEHVIGQICEDVSPPCDVAAVLVEYAWTALREGSYDRYLSHIRTAIAQSDAEVIILAQPSMAPAAGADSRVLSAPAIALQAIENIFATS